MKANKSLPNYETLSRQLHAFLELNEAHRARFVDVWSRYLEYLEDPNVEQYRIYNAERITAKIEGREPSAPPEGYKSPVSGLPAGTVPKSKEEIKVVIDLDEMVMLAPRDFTKGIVNIIRGYNAAGTLPASDRLSALDDKLKELYKV